MFWGWKARSQSVWCDGKSMTLEIRVEKNLYCKLVSALVEKNKGTMRIQVLPESCGEERVFELGPKGCLNWKDTVEKATLE